MTNPSAMELIAQALTDPAKINATELIAGLVQANYDEYAATTQAVIDGQRRTIAALEAELGAIRLRMNELFSGDYMPNQSAIEIAVFHPDRALIKRLTDERLARKDS